MGYRFEWCSIDVIIAAVLTEHDIPLVEFVDFEWNYSAVFQRFQMIAVLSECGFLLFVTTLGPHLPHPQDERKNNPRKTGQERSVREEGTPELYRILKVLRNIEEIIWLKSIYIKVIYVIK